MPIADELADLMSRRAASLGAAGASVQLDTSRAASDLAERLERGDRDAGATVLALAWPVGAPTLEWSTTDLGRAVTITTWPEGEPVPFTRAAAMLGVSRARVQQLAHAGRLDVVDGGATLASVLQLRADRA